MEDKEIKDDEEIELDFSKVTNIFKKKKASSGVNEIAEQVKENIKEEEIKIKELRQEEIEEKEKLNQFKKDEDELDKIEDSVEKEEKKIEKSMEKIEEIKDRVEKDEEIIDLKKIKNLFNFKKFKGEGDGFVHFLKKNKYAIPVLLILLAMSFSIFFRAYPNDLPITDNWAEDSVYRFYRNQVENEINQQYPNLPEMNKQSLIESNFQKLLKEQKSLIKGQIEGLSNQYKDYFKDENGQTYLLAIDPYLWYGQARNVVNNGHLGDKIDENGNSVYTLRGGREDKAVSSAALLPWFEAYLFKFVHFFNRDATLLGVVFMIPLLIITLSVIPTFFIAKRIGGNVGGFFAAFIVAVNAALLARTPAGFADTDAFNIFFPLFAAWMFLEAFEAKTIKKRLIFGSLSGFFMGLFAWTWGGWAYIFNFIFAALGVYLLYYAYMHRDSLKKGIKEFVKQPEIKNTLFVALTIYLSTGVFVTLFSSFRKFSRAFLRPVQFMFMKDVAIKTLWPNVLTTVAEFNEVALKNIIGQMGGNLLFAIAALGIVLMILKKNKEGKRDIKYAVFLIIWFIGTLYSFTKGVRFAILMVPAFAIAFGAATGILYDKVSKWMTKGLHVNNVISKSVVLILIGLLLISPLKSADSTGKQEIPSMNDDWYNALTGIKDASEDAIITSWWDFGHWFVTIAERRVTFDGGDQGERIHWVGKSLLTSDEKLSIGILKMLNCGHEKAPHVLEEFYDGDTVKAIEVLDKILVLDKKEAGKVLEENGLKDTEVKEMLELTHCEDLIDQYYITSEDMIKKAGVWAHFGGWNFEKALMFQTIKKGYLDDRTGGVEFLQKEINLSEEKADEIYDEIKNLETSRDADTWISSWPSYTSEIRRCNNLEDGKLQCDNGLIVDLEEYSAQVSTQQGVISVRSLVYVDGDDVVEKKFTGDVIPYAVALIPRGNDYYTIWMDSRLGMSMFTRLFFFGGHGLEYFEPFSQHKGIAGTEIYIYSVDWEGKEKNDAFSSKEVVEVVEEKDEEVDEGDENSSEKEFEIEI